MIRYNPSVLGKHDGINHATDWRKANPALLAIGGAVILPDQ